MVRLVATRRGLTGLVGTCRFLSESVAIGMSSAQCVRTCRDSRGHKRQNRGSLHKQTFRAIASGLHPSCKQTHWSRPERRSNVKQIWYARNLNRSERVGRCGSSCMHISLTWSVYVSQTTEEIVSVSVHFSIESTIESSKLSHTTHLHHFFEAVNALATAIEADQIIITSLGHMDLVLQPLPVIFDLCCICETLS